MGKGRVGWHGGLVDGHYVDLGKQDRGNELLKLVAQIELMDGRHHRRETLSLQRPGCLTEHSSPHSDIC